MRNSRATIRAIGAAAIVSLGFGLAAAPAAEAQISWTSSATLLAQLKRNPAKILDPLWLLQATNVQLKIPATLRLNKKNRSATGWAPSTSRAQFEIGEVLDLGTKVTTLYGTQKLNLQIGPGLGQIRMEIPAQAGGNGTASGPGLNAAPVSLFTDERLTATPYAETGCTDFPSAVPGYTSPSPDVLGLIPPGSDPGTSGALPTNAQTAWLAAGLSNSYNRTSPLSLKVPAPVKGSANIFTGKLAPITLTTTFNIANVARFLSGANRCRQAWSGSTPTTVALNLEGELHLAPGLTVDNKIKLSDIELSTPAGKESNIELGACLSNYKFFTTPPTTSGGPKVTTQPTAPCGADGSAVPASQGGAPNFTGGGLGLIAVPAIASVTSLKGELLIG